MDSDEDIISRLRSEFPVVWMIVSDGNNSSISERNVSSFLRQKGLDVDGNVAEKARRLFSYLSLVPPMKTSKARSRWKILRGALLGSTSGNTSEALFSVRRHPGFNLFTQKPYCFCKSEPYFDYSEVCVNSQASFVMRKMASGRISLKDLVSHHQEHGVDNTGNVCVWPAEEVLGYYSISRPELFSGKRVCELGAGMTGLAGLTIAVTLTSSEVVITDGNPSAVENLQWCVDYNSGLNRYGNTRVYASQLVWDRDGSDALTALGKFDVVVAGDCLFFSDFHVDLVATILALLAPGGVALLLAPRRGQTFAAFVEHAQKDFHVRESNRYQQEVWEKHLSFLGPRVAQGKKEEKEVHVATAQVGAAAATLGQFVDDATSAPSACSTSPKSSSGDIQQDNTNPPDDGSTTPLQTSAGAVDALYDPDLHYPVLLELRAKD